MFDLRLVNSLLLQNSQQYSQQQESICVGKIRNWCQENNNEPDYLAARNNILMFLNTPQNSTINLSNLGISSLPDIFSEPEVSIRLKQLHLSNTQVTEFPDNYYGASLEELDLSNTPVSELPNNFNPFLLKRLVLNDTHITQLPDNFAPLSLEVLNLSNTQITSIPDSFDSSNLKELKLKGTAIASLPDSLDVSSLEVLDLSNTPLTSLPSEFNPPKLQALYLGGSQVASLADNFSPPLLETLSLDRTPILRLPQDFNPNGLSSLDLSYTQISELPEGFNPRGLYWLDLTSTQVASLPQNFMPEELQFLHLKNSQITSIPEGFSPCNLETLDLSGSPITRLPENFCPEYLEDLNISNTQITNLPESIFTLPNTCTISLSMANFSEHVRTNLQQRTEDPSYQGPRFEFDMGSAQLEDYSSTTLEEAFAKVFETADIQVENLDTLLDDLTKDRSEQDKNNLKVWLCRLFETASGKTDRNKFYFRSIVETIKEAAKNPEMKAIFYVVLQTACTTCGDRVALSALHFDLQKKLAQLDISKPSDAYNFLVNGVFIMDKLEKFAMNLVPTLPLTDPLEVFLGLPVRLKKDYRIPINTEEMLYFGCSGLKDDHLDQARADLDADLKNEDTLLSFLIEQPKWLEVLSFVYPSEITRLQDKRDEDAADPETSVTALENYNKGLKSLSKKARRIGRASRRIRA